MSYAPLLRSLASTPRGDWRAVAGTLLRQAFNEGLLSGSPSVTSVRPAESQRAEARRTGLTLYRVRQARNAIQQRRFPRARSAEQNRESGQSAEVDIHVEAAFGIRKAFADADFEFGRDCLRRCWSRGLWRGSSLHFHGPTDHGRRFKPYTTDSRTKETARSTSAVWFALE